MVNTSNFYFNVAMKTGGGLDDMDNGANINNIFLYIQLPVSDTREVTSDEERKKADIVIRYSRKKKLKNNIFFKCLFLSL